MGGSCSVSCPCPFQQLARALPPMSPLAGGESPAQWHHWILWLRRVWICTAPLSIRSSLLEVGFKDTSFPGF